jgi:hypothetical protein
MLFPKCQECNFYPCLCGKRQYIEGEEFGDKAWDIDEEMDRLDAQMAILDQRIKQGDISLRSI